MTLKSQISDSWAEEIMELDWNDSSYDSCTIIEYEWEYIEDEDEEEQEWADYEL